MNREEKKLSDYIDSLNEEKKPKEHGSQIETPEMKQLFKTVRMMKGLKEPSLPKDDYPQKLAFELQNQLSQKQKSRKPRSRKYFGVASIAAALIIGFILTIVSPFGQTNMVYAMEKAFQEIKAYHGVIEIVETNEDGQSTEQAKLEVWADKEGRYYVKESKGTKKDLITVNDGQEKWQIQPEQKQVNTFPAFPDSYSFTFELGKEIDKIKNAVKTKEVGEDTVAGRSAVIMEVTPKGGNSYKIWIDKETKMPLQKQSAMENSLQYKISYREIDFVEEIPEDFLTYNAPKGFKEINTDPVQLVNNLEEAKGIVGFIPKVPQNLLESYAQDYIGVQNDSKVVKVNYTSMHNGKNVVILQKKATGQLKPSSRATLGKVGNNIAEIQAPIQDGVGILGGGAYSGVTDINSIRWQQNDFEYAVVGNISLEELKMFVEGLSKETVELSSEELSSFTPEVEVPVDLEIEKGDQKNADAGHSPWKLDPAFVSQVFVSLEISPEGIKGEYPIKEEELKVVQNNGKEAVVEVSGNKTPIKKVYLKRLIRQDETGIWTVVGYDPANKK